MKNQPLFSKRMGFTMRFENYFFAQNKYDFNPHMACYRCTKLSGLWRSLYNTKRTIFALNHCYYFYSVSRLCQTYYNDGLYITRFIHWQPTMHNEPNEKRIESQKSVRNGCSDQQKKNELFVEWIAYQF